MAEFLRKGYILKTIEFSKILLGPLNDDNAKLIGILEGLENVYRNVKGMNTIDIVCCINCIHRDPEDKKCDCGALERAGCIFTVADDYFCKHGERRRKEDGNVRNPNEE